MCSCKDEGSIIILPAAILFPAIDVNNDGKHDDENDSDDHASDGDSVGSVEQLAGTSFVAVGGRVLSNHWKMQGYQTVELK